MRIKKFTQQQIIIALAALIIIAGLVIGLVLGTAQVNYAPNQPSVPTNNCRYNGNLYKDKDTFKSIDDCNTCSCIDGRVMCTARACAQDDVLIP